MLLTPFIEHNFKKIPKVSGSRVMRTLHFWTQNSPFAPNENFFRNTINIISMYLLAPCTEQNFFKNLRVDPEPGRRAIFEPKMVQLPQLGIFLEGPLM